jgi:hypothetical protein
LFAFGFETRADFQEWRETVCGVERFLIEDKLGQGHKAN